jgi:hypothetical protein
VTADMSSHGILIQTRERLPKGRMLEVQIEWPGVYHDKPLVCLAIVGVVARDGATGIALRMVRHEFCDFEGADEALRKIAAA